MMEQNQVSRGKAPIYRINLSVCEPSDSKVEKEGGGLYISLCMIEDFVVEYVVESSKGGAEVKP